MAWDIKVLADTLLDSNGNSIADKVDGTIDVVQITGNTRKFCSIEGRWFSCDWGYGNG